MFIERLLNQGNAPLLEQRVRFAAQRMRLLADNQANISTPDYQQKDLDEGKFDRMLRERVARRRESAPGSVGFDDMTPEILEPKRGVLFHDGNNRTVEQLMSDVQSNGLKHNLWTELLRKSYGSIENALKERVT
jgi:flagellar basal-body rod protein FlgB